MNKPRIPTNPATRRERQRCLKWIAWSWGPGIDKDLMIKRVAVAEGAIRSGERFAPPPTLMTEAEYAEWVSR